jgi:catechol 2,3-dioxygenase-like lactoylglutathione lyase family enzyme
VRLCRECVERLAGQVGVISTPTLPVSDFREGVEFYERAGFGVRVYEDDEGSPGEGFAFVDLDGQSVFDLDVLPIDRTRNWAGCYLIVRDPDGWHAAMIASELPVTPIADTPWGMREFTLTDPFGNHVRIGRGLSAP